MSKYLLLIFPFLLSPFPAFGMENIASLENHLADIDEAQLHFFWTSGRRLEDSKEEFGANNQIKIGGEEYATAFTESLKLFLQHTPAKIKVIMVLDALTLASNKTWLNHLQMTFPDRLAIIDVGQPEANLLKLFPEHTALIKSIFKNAQSGNPAIASDIYRLLGLIFCMTTEPKNIHRTRFSYCDVDTFVHGLKDLRAPDLFQALFGKPTETKQLPGLHISSGHCRNDIITIESADLLSYKTFCGEVLRDLSTLSKESPIFSYFPLLHAHITDQRPNIDVVLKDYLNYVASSTFEIRSIIYKTGPHLLDTLKRRGLADDLCDYPSISTFSWHGAQILDENSEIISFRPFKGYPFTDWPELKNKMYDYRNRIGDTFYVRRFGQKHPFYLKLISWLKENNPYLSPLIKPRLQTYYQDDLYRGYSESLDRWLLLQINWLKGKYRSKREKKNDVNICSPFYLKLQHVLKELDIDFELTPADIDFRKNS